MLLVDELGRWDTQGIIKCRCKYLGRTYKRHDALVARSERAAREQSPVSSVLSCSAPIFHRKNFGFGRKNNGIEDPIEEQLRCMKTEDVCDSHPSHNVHLSRSESLQASRLVELEYCRKSFGLRWDTGVLRSWKSETDQNLPPVRG